MTINPGLFVIHNSAPQWGAGKVVAVSLTMATIEFSDGKSRKIASSHFDSLEPTTKAWIALPEAEPEVKPRRTSKTTRTK